MFADAVPDATAPPPADAGVHVDPSSIAAASPSALSAPAVEPVGPVASADVPVPSDVGVGAPDDQSPESEPITLGLLGTAAPEERGPIGFVDQRGSFTAVRAGSGTITALYRGRLITVPVTVKGRPAALPFSMIRVSLSKDRSGPDNRGILVIHVIRGDGRPVVGAGVQITVTGGSADNTTATTDVDGEATVGITWDQPTGGLATVSSAGLSSATLGQ